MDINSIPVSGATQFYSPPVTTTTTDPTPAQTVPEPKVQATSVVAQAQTGTSNEYQAAKQAAAAAPFNYPLGDKEFSIFKDATGKLITRYVSLRDGSVTYIPNPTFVKPISIQA